MKNGVTRYLTAGIAIPLIFALIQWGPKWGLDFLIALCFLLALSEWTSILNSASMQVPPFLTLVLGFILLASAFLCAKAPDDVLIFAAVAAVLAGASAYKLFFHSNDLNVEIQSLAIMIFAVGVVCWGGGALIYLWEKPFCIDNRNLIYLLLAMAWLGDTGAMHVGKMLKGKKLAPVISPNKTISGLFGAMIFSVLGAFAADYIFSMQIPALYLICLGPSIALISHVGDLTTSMFKRAAQVKDSGNLIPGHGGFLDRLDNLLFTAPFLYIFAMIFWHN